MGARWPDTWEWCKVRAGHYRAEGYEIQRIGKHSQRAWWVRRIGETAGTPCVTLESAIDFIDHEMRYTSSEDACAT